MIDRLSADLKEEFTEMSGFSPRNLKYMRTFAETWPDAVIVQQVVAQLQWRSIITLMTKLRDNPEREWYAQRALQYGWSSNVLLHMIDIRLIEREGKAVTNFAVAIPPQESDMATQIFKDPYIRQVHLEVGGDDFYIDLLFYLLKLRCYIVVELKARKFDPGDIAQLSFYQNIVDDVLRHPDDKPTIGLLLVREKNRTVVEYSLSGFNNPMGVADWQNEFDMAVEDIKANLPTVEEIEKEISLLDTAIIAEEGDGDE